MFIIIIIIIIVTSGACRDKVGGWTGKGGIGLNLCGICGKPGHFFIPLSSSFPFVIKEPFVSFPSHWHWPSFTDRNAGVAMTTRCDAAHGDLDKSCCRWLDEAKDQSVQFQFQCSLVQPSPHRFMFEPLLMPHITHWISQRHTHTHLHIQNAAAWLAFSKNCSEHKIGVTRASSTTFTWTRGLLFHFQFCCCSALLITIIRLFAPGIDLDTTKL